MKAMVLDQYQETLDWRDLPDPGFDADEVVIRVGANGLCATDLKIVDGLVPTVPLPHVMGHEVAGEVVEVGAKVQGLAPGDHVTVYPTRSCGFCDYCRRGEENHCLTAPRTGFEVDGGFSQYMRVLGRNAVKISSSVPLEEAAIIPDAMATGYHGLVERAKVQVGETVVVVGLGGLGIHTLQLAGVMGARVIACDVVPEKLEAARQLGADVVINGLEENLPDRVKELTSGIGAEVVVEGVAGPVVPQVLQDSIACLKLSGRLVVMGYGYGMDLRVDTADLIYGQWSLLGTRASNLQDVVEVVKLVEQGRLKPIVSERLPLEQANEALTMLRESPPLGRIVLMA